MPKYMTVRSAAEQLGVHENTLRRWETQGIVRAVHLPGSNFRRFRPADIDRLANDMVRRLERDHSDDMVDSAAPAMDAGPVNEDLWDS